ncbi:16S rRNA (cytidine(1402)-2'-O)-methyltransferase [Neotabrizicola sp. VNH66]|uniref:16S rRNA (cytidine(1402)-2'-O)-methyltransferase n=1 Tax=Neotabrizicola sp. VNH66 TaxID=3400918 RepID=UPI003BFEE245
MSGSAPFRPAAGAVAPGLHLVSTPIGAARDITLRALDLLAGADVLAAEDTRTLRHLMEIHGIALNKRPLLAVHDHNEQGAVPRVLAALEAGQSVAYASEAGTPLVSDPGFILARAAAEAGHPVLAAPGPSAVLAALTVAGLPADRFLFAGFPPAAAGERKRFLEDFAPVQATLILYESPHRVARTLADLAAVLGGDRRAALCRELTKRHEEVIRDSLSALAELYETREPRGEYVLVVDRAAPQEASAESVEQALKNALESMSVKDAAAFVSQTLGIPRKLAYQMALTLGRS